MKKRIMASFMTLCILLPLMASTALAEETPKAAGGTDLAPSARSAILMDADTGTVIFEKNSHDQLPPASITKIMTMLLTDRKSVV